MHDLIHSHAHLLQGALHASRTRSVMRLDQGRCAPPVEDQERRPMMPDLIHSHAPLLRSSTPARRRHVNGDAGERVIRAPRGSELSCRGWTQEAALRMLMNNLDPDVAERPEDLVVYGGTGKAARDWPSFDAIVRTLRTLADDETLLVQSGKPVAVFRTHEGRRACSSRTRTWSATGRRGSGSASWSGPAS
jgi:hypothetical protein